MSPWEPGPRLLGNLYIIILGTLTTFTWKTWDPCREPWRNLEGTFWEPFGNREGTLRNLGNLERTLGTLGTLSEPWEPWEPLLGNLGTFTWEPGNLYLGTFTWNLGTLGEWVLELLRSAPKPLLWLKTPKHSAVGEKDITLPFLSVSAGGCPSETAAKDGRGCKNTIVEANLVVICMVKYALTLDEKWPPGASEDWCGGGRNRKSQRQNRNPRSTASINPTVKAARRLGIPVPKQRAPHQLVWTAVTTKLIALATQSI